MQRAHLVALLLQSDTALPGGPQLLLLSMQLGVEMAALLADRIQSGFKSRHPTVGCLQPVAGQPLLLGCKQQVASAFGTHEASVCSHNSTVFKTDDFRLARIHS